MRISWLSCAFVMIVGGASPAFGQSCIVWETGPRAQPSFSSFRMAYDSLRGVVVGTGDTGDPNRMKVVEWNGEQWTEIPQPGLTFARQEFGLAFDEARGVTVMYGGRMGATFLMDTRAWDGVEWTLLTISGPERRAGHAMAYDAQRREITCSAVKIRAGSCALRRHGRLTGRRGESRRRPGRLPDAGTPWRMTPTIARLCSSAAASAARERTTHGSGTGRRGNRSSAQVRPRHWRRLPQAIRCAAVW